MDNVTTSKSQTNDKVGPTTSEDPKSFVCDHNAMRSGLVDVIVHQSQRQASIEKDQTENEKKLDELQHFLMNMEKNILKTLWLWKWKITTEENGILKVS